jgi:uncharacterized protein (TIGR02453 family)
MKQPPDFDIDFFPPFEGFPGEGIRFLRDLRKNNNRDWFQAHKTAYEESVKLPMQSLIAALQPGMRKLAPEFELNPKRDIFRIYRDVRFSKDKSPYKTHAAAVFHAKGTRWEGCAGFYVHIEPGEIYAGGGIYMPDPKQLKLIRQSIAERSKEFLGILNRKSFTRNFSGFEGEKLTRVPKGFAPDHPMGEWLKFKSYYAGVTWSEKVCRSDDFPAKLLGLYGDMLPLVRFLNRALGIGAG